MRIITEEEITNTFALNIYDNIYEKYLTFYKLLENNEDVLLNELNGISLSDILYSKYYWFLKLKREHESINGIDSGCDQQAFNLMVNIHEYSSLDIDINCFEVIQDLVYGK